VPEHPYDELTVAQRLWWPYWAGVVVAVVVMFGLTVLLIGVCGIAENVPELFAQRCRSTGWKTLPLWGLAILVAGRIAAGRAGKPWIAGATLALSFVPSYLAWQGFDSAG
jgi:hypothetical protein